MAKIKKYFKGKVACGLGAVGLAGWGLGLVLANPIIELAALGLLVGYCLPALVLTLWLLWTNPKRLIQAKAAGAEELCREDWEVAPQLLLQDQKADPGPQAPACRAVREAEEIALAAYERLKEGP
jgi:hypothetical protein